MASRQQQQQQSAEGGAGSAQVGGLAESNLTSVDLEEAGGPAGAGAGAGAGAEAEAEAEAEAGAEAGAAAAAAKAAAGEGAARAAAAGLDVEAGATGGGDGGALSPGRSSTRGIRQRPPEGLMGNPMEGVGEDEKAYNYICNLDKVNLGGPGWFNDIFKISVELDADRTWVDTLSLSLVPRNVFRRHCPLLDTRDNITGTVTVEAPTSKSVWLQSVTVTFEEHLMTLDSDDTGMLMGALESKVAAGQFIKDKTVFHFSLDLTLLDGHRRWPVRETYVGDLMALRHRLVVSAQRPWYTFNVYSQIPLAMECLSSAPDEDAGQENEEGGPNHVLVISDCNGRCEFDFGVDSFNLGDVLHGIVRFTDVTSLIAAAHVLVLRAEFLYGEASEVLVAEHTLLGERRVEQEPISVEGLSEEEQVRRQFMSPFVEQKDVLFVQTEEEDRRMEAVMGDAEISVNVPLHVLPLTPSHMSLAQDIAAVNDEADLVGVRYYIRLILEDDAQKAYWHTHEIFFHRSEPMLSSQEMDDNNSSNDGGVYDTEAGYANDYANEPSNNSDSNSGPVGGTANNGHGSGAAAAAAMADVDVGAAGAHAGGFGEGRDEVEVDLGEGREKVVGASAA
ncbi:unnamed protein product [Pylaiella littoralis]